MPNNNRSTSPLFQHEDNIEEVDYLSDIYNDDEESPRGEDAEDEEETVEFFSSNLVGSDDAMEIVPLTPSNDQDSRSSSNSKGTFTRTTTPQKSYTPLARRENNNKANSSSRPTALVQMVASSHRMSNFLTSFKSPQEILTRRKPDLQEGFSVDNRTKTRMRPLQSAESNESASDSQSPVSYFPSKYMIGYSTPQQRQTSFRYSDSQAGSLSTSRVQADSTIRASPSSSSCASPAAQSVGSYSNFTTASSNPRRQSMMSHRSSTSMSLLFGEVINLEEKSQMATVDGRPRSVLKGVSNRSLVPYGDGRPSTGNDTNVDVDMLEGMEIGGSNHQQGAVRTFRGVVVPLTDPGEPSAPIFSLDVALEYISEIPQHISNLGRLSRRQMMKIKTAMNLCTRRIVLQYRPPLSPRTRELDDLSYLQHAHKQKVGLLREEDDTEDHYDFALVLTPQEVYRFWAEILDFRVEHLGVETFEPAIETASTNSTDSQESSDEFIHDEVQDYSTPLTGMHRRRGKPLSSAKKVSSAPRPSFAMSESQHGRPSSSHRKQSRLSMFDKAIGFTSPSLRGLKDGNYDDLSPMKQPRGSITSNRRRWGNRSNRALGTATMLSPPVRSLTRGSASVRKLRSQSTPNNKVNTCLEEIDENGENKDPNRINSEEDIPNPVIPRGIAARTNGMLPFLSALKRGIVVRRHRANRDPVYCKILSKDGGDTIRYQLVDVEEAMVAFKEQRVRFNRKLTHGSSPASVRAISKEWSCLGDNADGSPVHKFKVPDHVAAQRYREKILKSQGVSKRFTDLATKAANSGIIRTSDIVAVHPASHLDPRHPGVRKGELGTASLRKSKAGHYVPHSFSLVSVVGQRFTSNSDASDNSWYSGEGSELKFKTLDFEAATEGEYWLVFRGFLLLHRDATVGRFASQRNAGIQGGGRRRDHDEDELDPEHEPENVLHRDEFQEPKNVGLLEKTYVKLRKLDDSYITGSILPSAVPPPSDYFLGFKSAGTQIWSRLRLAGFETQRVYSVDSRRVMIKLRCPEDRLTDVAEVLRLKMKTVDDTFAPFREDTADLFRPLDDPLDVPQVYRGNMASLLRSKYRQAIIDFIIGSRIRDSGAELGQTTDVGKMIQARVPLHMPQKLESIYRAWVYYWRKENWAHPEDDFREFQKAEEAPFESGDGSSSKKSSKIPHFATRFLIGAFHQPLDSVEEYFGEQVTFYFAWLQHCSTHLLFLSVLGLIVTICMAVSDNVDHPIRPFFSMVVMIWSFIVLVNWRKRSSDLSYRWGSMHQEIQETPRPEFHGEYVMDDITQEWVVKYPPWKRWLKYMISIPICIAFTGTALMLILLVHANRDLQMANYVEQLSNPNAEPFEFELSLDNIGKKAKIVDMEITKEFLVDPTFWVVMGALPAMLGLCIPIMNIILMKISIMLNDFENYRTESEYRTHLIIKVFSFRFVSQLGTIYYYAFISTGTRKAIENGIIRMGTSVMIYTTVAHWWQIFLQVYFFMLIRNIRRFFYRRKLQEELKNIELEEEQITSELSDAESRQMKVINKRMLLDQAQDSVWFEIMNPPHNSFPEYITAVVQFSFVSCFSVVLPITPLLVLLNYLLSIRFDAYKLCRGRQRPLAKKTGGIGVWEHLLHIVTVIAVLTNCWLIGFASSDFTWLADKVGTLGLFGIVVAWEHVMLLIKYVMQNSVSTLPRTVRDEIKKKEHDAEQERYSNLRMRQQKGRRSKFDKSGTENGKDLKDPIWPEGEGSAKNLFQTPDNDQNGLQTILSEEDLSNLYTC